MVHRDINLRTRSKRSAGATTIHKNVVATLREKYDCTWAVSHRADLEVNWENMKAGRALDAIEPLD